MLRTGCGFVNVFAAYIQCFLANSVNAYKYGLSHSIQRTENYWSHLKKNPLAGLGIKWGTRNR